MDYNVPTTPASREDDRLVAEIINCSLEIAALRSQLQEQFGSHPSETQMRLWEAMNAAEDNCNDLKLALRAHQKVTRLNASA